MYATNAGAAWTRERIYSEGEAGRFVRIVLDSAGLPRVAFFQADLWLDERAGNRGAMVSGAFDGAEWHFEHAGSLDAQVLGFEGARCTVALALAGDDPVVALIDESRFGLATVAGGTWNEETVLVAAGDPLQVVGLAIDTGGSPHLTFATTTGSGPPDGEVWYVRPVAKAGWPRADGTQRSCVESPSSPARFIQRHRLVEALQLGAADSPVGTNDEA